MLVAVITTVNIMQAKDILGRSQKCPSRVAYSKLRVLDDMLQKDRKQRHVMSKSEFRRKMLRGLQRVRVDEKSGDGLQSEIPTPQE